MAQIRARNLQVGGSIPAHQNGFFYLEARLPHSIGKSIATLAALLVATAFKFLNDRGPMREPETQFRHLANVIFKGSLDLFFLFTL